MSPTTDETFRIPLLPWIGILAAVAGAALPWAWFDTTLVLAILGLLIVFAAYTVWVFKLVVREDGIVMYRLNRMAWSEVQSARFRSVMGLPYLWIQRQHGVPWWLPLYFRGVRDLRHVLVERAPRGNPIGACLIESVEGHVA
jgi:hypothetical protein